MKTPDKLIKENYSRIYNWVCDEGLEIVDQRDEFDDDTVKPTKLASRLPEPKEASLSEMNLLFLSVSTGMLQWLAGKKDVITGKSLLTLAQEGLSAQGDNCTSQDDSEIFQRLYGTELFNEYKALFT